MYKSVLGKINKLQKKKKKKNSRWPPQCHCVVIESSFDPGERLQAPGSLWSFLL
jgi:hypothetical protein